MTCQHPEIITASSGAKWCRTCGTVNPKPPEKPKAKTIKFTTLDEKIDYLTKEYFRWYAYNSLFAHGEIRAPGQ